MCEVFMNILFVCTGNTCRSSMAEGIFKYLLEKSNIEDISVSSAGISVFEGEASNKKAIDALIKKGIDIRDHKARQLTKNIVEESDLILTMTESHKAMILNAVAGCSDRVYTLKEFACIINGENAKGRNLDIADPFGLDYNSYERSAEEIKEQLNKIIKNINAVSMYEQRKNNR